MEHQEIEVRLSHKAVKPTANRILVYRQLAAAGRPMTLADLEAAMPQMDKSSIFRVLTLFLEHDVVHSFGDGRGVLNYELCSSDGACSHADGHVHFYCESCQQTYCLEDFPLPDVPLPDGFSAHSASYVVKGECPDCRARHHHL